MKHLNALNQQIAQFIIRKKKRGLDTLGLWNESLLVAVNTINMTHIRCNASHGAESNDDSQHYRSKSTNSSNSNGLQFSSVWVSFDSNLFYFFCVSKYLIFISFLNAYTRTLIVIHTIVCYWIKRILVFVFVFFLLAVAVFRLLILFIWSFSFTFFFFCCSTNNQC